MAVSGDSAFSPTGPFHFQAPKQFDGNTGNLEEFNYKLKAYCSIMNTVFKKATDKVEEDPQHEVIDMCFKDDQRDPRAKLVEMASQQLQWILDTQCIGPASTFLRRWTARSGFENWWQLVQRYEIRSKARAVGRLSNMLRAGYGDRIFEDSLAIWEHTILKYQKPANIPGTSLERNGTD